MPSEGKKGEGASYKRGNEGGSAQGTFAIVKDCLIEVSLMLFIWVETFTSVEPSTCAAKSMSSKAGVTTARSKTSKT